MWLVTELNRGLKALYLEDSHLPRTHILTQTRVRDMLVCEFGTLLPDLEVDIHTINAADVPQVWDRYYGHTVHAWETWSRQNDYHLEGINGFAVRPHVFVVRESQNTGTLLHELLHAYTAPDWVGVTGHAFDEGVTDYLKHWILLKHDIVCPTSYIGHLTVVTTMMQSGVSLGELTRAYFWGGHWIQALIDTVDRVTFGGWAFIADALNRNDFRVAMTLASRRRSLELPVIDDLELDLDA